MDDRIRITVELEPADHQALSGIASEQAQSLTELAVDVLRERIRREDDFDDAVRAGLDDIAAGRVVSHEAYLGHAAERRQRWLDDRHA